MVATIRTAQPGDLEGWLPLWHGYCDFYQASIDPDITMTTWARILDPMSALECRLATVGGNLVGFAHHHTHLTTWDKRPVCYLEDLFVSNQARGLGIGRALLDDLAALGRDRNWSSIYWITQETNKVAQGLYESVASRDPFFRYVMTP